eukprot:1342501-Amphidinium_carterae.1
MSVPGLRACAPHSVEKEAGSGGGVMHVLCAPVNCHGTGSRPCLATVQVKKAQGAPPPEVIRLCMRSVA